MSPSGSGPAAVPAAPSDPRELALHLEICRMQAELEGLEARIHQVEAAKAAGGSGYDPFVERAEELVDRMVASLYLTGRSEIAASAVASDEQAEAVLADARRRAQDILNAARSELATVLSERADVMDASGAVPGGIVDLTDDADIADATTEADALPSPVAPIEAAVLPLSAYPPPGADVPVEPVEPEVDTGPVDADASAEPNAAVEEPAPIDESMPAGPTAPAVPAEVVGPSPEPPTPDLAEAVGPVGRGDDSASAPVPPAVGTDAAFEAWLAVAPARAPLGTDAAIGLGNDEALPYSEHRGDGTRDRPAWVRPVEGVLALVAVALVVIVALLIVG